MCFVKLSNNTVDVKAAGLSSEKLSKSWGCCNHDSHVKYKQELHNFCVLYCEEVNVKENLTEIIFY